MQDTCLIDRVSKFYDVSYIIANNIIIDYTDRDKLSELLDVISLKDDELINKGVQE